MKKLLLVLLVLGVAAAIGYMLGTEQGRQHRDETMARLRGADDSATGAVADLTDAATNGADQPEVAGI